MKITEKKKSVKRAANQTTKSVTTRVTASEQQEPTTQTPVEHGGAGAAKPPLLGSPERLARAKKPRQQARVQQGAAKVDARKITLLVEKNPKQELSKAHKRFELYKNGMTVSGYLAAGVSAAT